MRVSLDHQLDLLLLLGGHDAGLLELRQQLVHLAIIASALGRLEDLGNPAADDRAARVLLGPLGDRSSILGLGKGLLERLDGEGVVADV
jgi:hypothetical protein